MGLILLPRTMKSEWQWLSSGHSGAQVNFSVQPDMRFSELLHTEWNLLCVKQKTASGSAREGSRWRKCSEGNALIAWRTGKFNWQRGAEGPFWCPDHRGGSCNLAWLEHGAGGAAGDRARAPLPRFVSLDFFSGTVGRVRWGDGQKDCFKPRIM